MSDGYVNPDSLVETSWLAQNLGDPRIAILDATFHLPGSGRDAFAEFQAAHVPGAQFFDIDSISDRSSALPHMLPSEDEFAARIGELGIGNDTHIIVYDTHGLMSAARAWWMFRVFGHDFVGVLNGGFAKWQAEDCLVSNQPAETQVSRFETRYHAELVADMAEIRQRLAADVGQIVDARAAERYSGEAEEIWPGRRRGHIPGSLNVPFPDLLNPADKTLLSAAEIRARFDRANVNVDRPPIMSCGSGITACVLAFGAHLIGQSDCAVYDGSWAEWGLPGPNPIEP